MALSAQQLHMDVRDLPSQHVHKEQEMLWHVGCIRTYKDFVHVLTGHR